MTAAETPPPRAFNRQPLLWLGACFGLGIASAKFAAIDALAVPVVVAVVFAIAALVARKYYVATVFVALAFIAAGVAAYAGEIIQANAPGRIRVLYDTGEIASGEPVEVEGVLAAGPEPAVEGYFLTLRAERLLHRGREREVSGNARIFVPLESGPPSEFSILNSPFSTLKYGSRIRAACNLERDDEFLNPGVTPTTELMDLARIDARASLKSALLIEYLADEGVLLPVGWIHDARTRLIETFRTSLTPSAAGVMIASLLGDKHFLDRDTADVFRHGGTFHILVISGLHITFIGGLLLWIISRFTQSRVTQFALTNACLWAYTFGVGADVPVVRAAIMFTVISFSYVIYRQSSLLNSLGLCALILLVWRPTDLFNPSFQLTFVSVAAIVGCAYPLIRHLRDIGEWTPSATTPFPPNVPIWLCRFCETIYWRDDAWLVGAKRNIWTANLFKLPYAPRRMVHGLQTFVRYLFEGILVSSIVLAWMLPLTVVYFHRFSPISILLNLWVGFFIALESFAAMLGAFAGNLSELLAAGFFGFAEAFNWLMMLLPRLFSDNGWVSFRLPAYEGAFQAIYFIYFVPVLLLAVAAVRWKPFDLKHRSVFTWRSVAAISATLILLAGVIIFHPFSAPRPDGRLRIDLLDVGQGDSIFITFPNGQTMLVDGGGRFDYRDDVGEGESFEPDVRGIGEAVVSEVLWAKGYSRIDHILATHAHADHIGGLNDVARNFSIGSAIFGRTPEDDPNYAALAEVLQQRRIPIETVSGGDVIRFGNVTVEVLYPANKEDSLATSDNDNSVVLRITYGDRVFLLTGDIEKSAETQLVSSCTLTADVVKVPHHGSRTSSTQGFVDAVSSQFAIISAPKRSPFGHPHPEVVGRWHHSGAMVLTTGTSGMTTASTDGSDLVVEEFVRPN
jgi:competence protein ComEC